MKSKTSISASRLTILVLAFLTSVCFNACSSSSDDDSSSSGQLSDEMTPVDFQFTDKSSGGYSIYDYAGNSYLGSHTIYEKKATVNLRQGKHRLLFFNGLIAGYDLNCDTNSKTVTMGDHGYLDYDGLTYTEKELDVTPNLLPVQQIKCESQMACAFRIEVTDLNYAIKNHKVFKKHSYIQGKTIGLPFVKKVSLSGNDYELNNKKTDLDTYIVADEGVGFDPDDVGSFIEGQRHQMLCPADGINNVQATVSMTDEDGKTIASITLPAFSLRRAHTTILRGPLFTGTTADWQILTEPYK